jgi:hypothetical protein
VLTYQPIDFMMVTADGMILVLPVLTHLGTHTSAICTELNITQFASPIMNCDCGCWLERKRKHRDAKCSFSRYQFGL